MEDSEKLVTYGTPDEDKQNKQHNTICVGHHYTQANTNNVNNTRVPSDSRTWQYTHSHSYRYIHT